MIKRNLVIVFLIAAAAVSATAKRPNDDAEVRAAVQGSFQLLKDGSYSALYDALPSAARKRMTRDGFVRQMRRTRGLYRLDSIDVGKVRVNGNTATADTTMYGRVLKPNEAEGKIIVRQQLVREGGTWRLGINGGSPQIYIKRDGKWIDVTRLVNSAGRR
jgi:hypothetical protein